jgi:hypothetical protein
MDFSFSQETARIFLGLPYWRSDAAFRVGRIQSRVLIRRVSTPPPSATVRARLALSGLKADLRQRPNYADDGRFKSTILQSSHRNTIKARWVGQSTRDGIGNLRPRERGIH